MRRERGQRHPRESRFSDLAGHGVIQIIGSGSQELKQSQRVTSSDLAELAIVPARLLSMSGTRNPHCWGDLAKLLLIVCRGNFVNECKKIIDEGLAFIRKRHLFGISFSWSADFCSPWKIVSATLAGKPLGNLLIRFSAAIGVRSRTCSIKSSASTR